MNPEHRIMTTAEPTLEQIADGSPIDPPYPTVIDMFLARELLALRGRIERCDEWSVQHGQMIDGQLKRLTALERVQRDAGIGEFREPSALERALTDSVAARTHERDEAYRNNAVLSEQRDEACRLLDGEQRNHNVTIKRVRDVTTERDAARAALRDLRSIVQLARDDLDIAQAGSETTPFARHDLLMYVATAYDRLDAALASATPAEGGEG